MNKLLIKTKSWLSKRTQREIIYIFISGFALIFLFYFLIFLRPTLANKRNALKEYESLQSKKIAMDGEYLSIQDLIKNPKYLEMLEKQRKLIQQISRIHQQIADFKPIYFTHSELAQLRTNILHEQKNVGMISLKEFPAEPWPPKDDANKDNILNSLKGVYQNQIGIQFRNQYFNTLDYIKKLEQISKSVYWDSLEYKVLEYPNAEVYVTFHVLSMQKS